MLFLAFSIVLTVAVPPPEWQPRIAQAQMLYTDVEPSNNEMMPSVGNGYVATVVGSDTIYLAGVFNGESTSGPSHRARIPATNSFTIVGGTPIGSGLDLEMGVFKRRVKLSNASIEQRWYAHRVKRSILVHEISVDNSASSGNLEFQLKQNTNPTSDFTVTQLPNGPTYSQYSAKIVTPEIPNGLITRISVVSTLVPSTLSVPAGQKETFYFITAFRSNLDSKTPEIDAQREFNSSNSNPGLLLGSHVSAWLELWNSRLEIGGDFNLAQVVNSSLYYIVSSIREDWPWSLSPGSLSSNSYNGHTFWDCETWMYPTILFCFPDIARDGILQYRVNSKDGAALKAKSYNKGYKGYMFAWESAFTGQETCPSWAPTGQLEQHITGDIAFAFRQYWYLSHDINWLRETAWPIIQGMAQFFESRVSFNSAIGKFEINGIIPPDEYAVNVDNSVYTNVVAALALSFGCEASEILQIPCPPSWMNISQNMKYPEDLSQDIYLEYDGYNGSTIKQADVILLAYPLMYPMTASRIKNNLAYYSSRTDKGGPAMTFSMETIGWLQVGMINEAQQSWPNAYANAQPPFLVWTETAHPPGGAVNFITGAGGFLQGILAGFGGLRLTASGLEFNPMLLNPVTSVKFGQIFYLNNGIQIFFDNSSVEISLTTCVTNCQKIVVNQGTQSYPLSLGNPVKLPVGVFKITEPGKAE